MVLTSKYGSQSYVIDKSRLSIRLTAPYSEARRKAAFLYAKKNGFGTEQKAVSG